MKFRVFLVLSWKRMWLRSFFMLEGEECYELGIVGTWTKRTEILYAFFGIHTVNVVYLADMIERRARLAAA